MTRADAVVTLACLFKALELIPACKNISKLDLIVSMSSEMIKCPAIGS